jgi:glyceraldehyde-3-phosphate dehydrogenase (NAD(P))
MIKVCVNGYGTIGRRVADAIALQPDMKLVGIVKTKPDYKAVIARKKGYAVYAPTEKELKEFERAKFEVAGLLNDALKEVDVVVDTTPEGMGEKNKQLYEKAGVKAIFEGGEEHTVAQISFVAQCNYDDAYGKDYIRCVSCNTTGLCRTLNALNRSFGIKKARAVIIRRAADPDDIRRGPLDAIVPDPITLPSHHGPDVKTVLPDLPITTVAVKVPVTHMHLHSLIVSLKNKMVKSDDVKEVFKNTTRLMLVREADGVDSTAQLFDWARDMGRSRNDIYEICIWDESITVENGELYFFQAIQQESNVIPENVDAIRAAMEAEEADDSIKLTNKTMGILQ